MASSFTELSEQSSIGHVQIISKSVPEFWPSVHVFSVILKQTAFKFLFSLRLCSPNTHRFQENCSRPILGARFSSSVPPHHSVDSRNRSFLYRCVSGEEEVMKRTMKAVRAWEQLQGLVSKLPIFTLLLMFRARQTLRLSRYFWNETRLDWLSICTTRHWWHS